MSTAGAVCSTSNEQIAEPTLAELARVALELQEAGDAAAIEVRPRADRLAGAASTANPVC